MDDLKLIQNNILENSVVSIEIKMPAIKEFLKYVSFLFNIGRL